MKTINCNATIFVLSFLFAQEEIIHINKTHQDGTPKEVIIYKRNEDDLKKNNPFVIIDKLKYDSKGKYITPPLKGEAKLAERWIVGKWASEEMDSLNRYLVNKNDNTYWVYEDGDVTIWGKIYISEDDGQIKLNFIKENSEQWGSQIILFHNKNRFILDGEEIFNRKH